ncbi:universal stress protein [Streptosporangium sp. NPDC000396]|uniref:universal stress protein n=1 Tax=Streptosporangium sp. NPDC000396 TaxID=3366185 RepID=UPI0036A4E75D
MPSSHRRHVVALDGSPNSIAALHRGVAETVSSGAELVVVHAVPETAAGDQVHRVAGEAMMSTLVEVALRRQPAVAASTVIVHGDPADAIIDHAEKADLLLIGAAFERPPFDGSTIAAVLRGCHCPVLVCSSPDLPGRMSWTVRLPARTLACRR